MYKSILTVVFILIGLAVGTYYLIFGFDRFFEPDVVEINLQTDKEIVFNLEVVKSCGHEVGIEFISENNEPGKFRTTFGDNLAKLNLPAKLSITILDANAETVFERKDFGGKKFGYRYDSTHIKFIAGRVRLLPGTYSVKINVDEIDQKLEGVKSNFFATHTPKTRCGE